MNEEKLQQQINNPLVLQFLGYNVDEKDKKFIGKDIDKFYKELYGFLIRDLEIAKINADNEENILSKDTSFKDIFKYRVVLALLLKYSLSEFENISAYEILTLIPNEKENFSLVKREDTESLNGKTKLVRYDLLFNMKMPSKLLLKGTKDYDKNKEYTSTVIVTMNIEHQGDYPINYDIKKRMSYYNCRQIAEQLHYANGKEDKNINYNKVHKVYAIWFCLGNVYKDDKYIIHTKEDGIVKTKETLEKDAGFDISEIVIIEYKKLANVIQRKIKEYCKEEITPEAELLYYLTKNDIKKTVEEISEYLKVDVKVEKKEVLNMGDALENFGNQRLQQGLQQGKLENAIIAINNGIKEEIMPSILSSILSVSNDFIYYVGDYFKANSDKTDEENVNALVEKVINGEILTK